MLRFCEKCGAKIENDGKFCTHCGAQMSEEQPITAPTAVQQEPVVEVSSVQEERVEKKQPSNKLVHRLLLTVLGVGAFVLLLVNWVQIATPFEEFFENSGVCFTLFQSNRIAVQLQNALGVYMPVITVPLGIVCTGLVLAVLLVTVGWIGAWVQKKWLAVLGVTGGLLGVCCAIGLLITTAVLNFSIIQYTGYAAGKVIRILPVAWMMVAVCVAIVVVSILYIKGSGLKAWLPSLLISVVAVLVIMGVAALIVVGTGILNGGPISVPQQQSPFPSSIFEGFGF